METKLSTPVVLSFAAGILFFIAYRINATTPTQEGIKLFITLVAAICALWAFVTGADYLIQRGIIHVASLREAWTAPTLALAREINMMDRDRIRLFERIGPFESIGYLSGSNMRWMLYTPMGNIPYSWVSEYLEKCELHYPRFIPQHGMPDSLQRDYVRWFTGLMVQNNMAEKPIGNTPAKWKLPIDQVYEKLGLMEV